MVFRRQRSSRALQSACYRDQIGPLANKQPASVRPPTIEAGQRVAGLVPAYTIRKEDMKSWRHAAGCIERRSRYIDFVRLEVHLNGQESTAFTAELPAPERGRCDTAEGLAALLENKVSLPPN
jgi:hypothetical protein